MSDSIGKVFYTSFNAFALSFIQLLWFLQSYYKSLSLSLEKAQCENNNLPPRHATNSIFIRGFVDDKRYTDIHTSGLRVSDQYQKVLPRPNIDFRISRGDNKFWGNDFDSFQGETSQSKESWPGNPRKGESNRQRTKQVDWEVIIHSNSSPSSSPPLSSISTSTDSEINLSQLFRGESGNLGGGKERTVMMEKKFNSLQREIFNFSPIANNNTLRFIITRLGRELSQPDNRGAVVRGGKRVFQKCLGAQGSQMSYNVLHIKRKGMQY